MRFQHQGMSLWCSTSDAPAPEGTIPASTIPRITVGVLPADASNRVELRFRVNGGPVETVPARWVRNDAASGAQYFTTHLPRLRPGDVVEFTPLAACAGRQVPGPAEADSFAAAFRVEAAEGDTTPRLLAGRSASGDRPAPESSYPTTGSPVPAGASQEFPIRADEAAVASSRINLRLVDHATGEPLVGYTVHAFDQDAGTGPVGSGPSASDRDGLVSFQWREPGPAPARSDGPQRQLRLHVVEPLGRESYETTVGAGAESEVVVPVPQAPGRRTRDSPETEAAKDAQARFLASVVTGSRVAGLDGLPAGAAAAVHSTQAQACGCQACLDAASPAAYLADLLSYAVRGLASIAGLQGRYHRGSNLTDLQSSRRDTTVDFDWGPGSTDPAIPSGPFSVQWTGQVRARFTGPHAFYVRCPGGVRFRVSERQLVDDWNGRTQVERSGTIHLSSGQWYDLTLECSLAAVGARSVQLSFSEAGRPRRVVPAQQLRSPGRGTSVELVTLVELLRQPFDRLPASCESVEQRLRQVRICVEVLRGYLDPPVSAPPWYLDTAYRMLLERVGTSFE